MYYLNHYVPDWEKVRTLEDLKRLIRALDIAFEPDCPNLQMILDLVKMERKPPVKFY